MPLRRTERSDGRQRPRWKDGSHVYVESTPANESRCDGIALEPNPPTEQLVEIPQLLQRNHEHDLSTRDRPARTGADARIEESVVMGEVRLALRPYGRRNNGCPGQILGTSRHRLHFSSIGPSECGTPRTVGALGARRSILTWPPEPPAPDSDFDSSGGGRRRAHRRAPREPVASGRAELRPGCTNESSGCGSVSSIDSPSGPNRSDGSHPGGVLHW